MKDIIKRFTAKCENCIHYRKEIFPTQSGTEIFHQCEGNEFFIDIDPNGWCYQYERKED